MPSAGDLLNRANLRRGGLVFLAAIAALVLIPPPVPAWASADQTCSGGFRLHFDDVANVNGIGFDDPNDGATRRGTACAVFDYLAANILQLGGTQPDVEVLASQLDGTGPIATGGSYYPNASSTGFIGGTLFQHITTGVDPTPALGSYDAHMQVDFGPRTIGASSVTIFSGYPASASGQLDLFSIMLHESMHALGFASFIGPTGASSVGNAYSLFDKYLRTTSGNPLLTSSAAPTSALPLALTSNALQYFKTGNSQPQSIYSPFVYQPGSTASHFDAVRDGFAYLMRASTSGGEDRQLTAAEVEVLCNIGYTLHGTLCTDHYPVGVADNNLSVNTTTPGTQICINVIANDTDPDGDTIWIDPASVVVYNGGNVTLVPTVHPTQICYTPSPYFAGTAQITYRPTDGQQAGLPTGVAVAVVSSVCPDNPISYLCNGGFELGVSATTPLDYASLTCGLSRVADWCQAGVGSPDLFIRGGISAVSVSFDIPSNFSSSEAPSGIVNTWNYPASGNDRYVGGLQKELSSCPEGLQTTLIRPLVPGATYDLEFHAYAVKQYANPNETGSNGQLLVYLDNVAPSGNVCPTLPGSQAQTVGTFTIPFPSTSTADNGWTHIQTSFVAAANANLLTHFVITPDGTGPPNADTYVFIDDIVLHEPGVTGPSSLTIDKTVDDAAPKLGQTINYTIKVCNTGTAVANNVVVNDTLPLGLTYVGGLSAYPQHTFSSIAPSTCVSVVLQAKVDNTVRVNTPITNCVGLVGSSPVRSKCVDIQIPATDVVVSKVLTASPAGLGGTAIFKITVSNLGPVNATGVVVHDTLPAGVTYLTHTITTGTATFGPLTRDLTIPSLPSQTSVVLNLSVKLGANICGQGTLQNAASLTAISQTDLNSENNDSSTTFNLPPCPAVDLSIKKLVSSSTLVRGAAQYFVLHVKNENTTLASGPGTVVSDILPAGLVPFNVTVTASADWSCVIAGQSVTCTKPTPIAPSGTYNIKIDFVTYNPASDVITNTAKVTNPWDPLLDNNRSSIDAQIVAAPNVPPYNIRIAKYAANWQPNYSFEINHQALFFINVTNNGPNSTSGAMVLTDVLPAGMVPTAAAAVYTSGINDWTCPIWGQAVYCSKPTAMASQEVTWVAITVNVQATAQHWTTNCANLLNVADAMQSDNLNICTSVEVQGGAGTHYDLMVEKNPIVWPPYLQFTRGSNVGYVVHVKNLGPDASYGTITLTDTMDGGDGWFSFGWLWFYFLTNRGLDPVSVSASSNAWSCSMVNGWWFFTRQTVCTRSTPMTAGEDDVFWILGKIHPKAGSVATNCAAIDNAMNTNPGNDNVCITNPIN